MSLAQITEKIEQDARAEAEKIFACAREQEAEINEETRAAINKIEVSTKLRFDRERPEIFRRRDIVAKLDAGKLLLGAKRRLIQDVFDSALTKMCSLGRDEYLVFCERLLIEASESGDEVIEISADEKHIDKDWLDKFNEKHGTKITLADKRLNISGGFLLSKNRVCINCSLEMLVQTAQEKLETEVVKRLFPAA